MRQTREYLWAGVCAALCMTLSGSALRAADEDQKPDAYATRAGKGVPMKSNKASTLIGMQVKNQNDERLGKIEDFVVDMPSGRISYVVLDAGGLLSDKLLAVPLNAFTPSSDHSYLILRADKTKLQAATGFDRNNWPSVSNPTWGADKFWDAPAGSEYRTPPPSVRQPQDVPPASPPSPVEPKNAPSPTVVPKNP